MSIGRMGSKTGKVLEEELTPLLQQALKKIGFGSMKEAKEAGRSAEVNKLAEEMAGTGSRLDTAVEASLARKAAIEPADPMGEDTAARLQDAGGIGLKTLETERRGTVGNRDPYWGKTDSEINTSNAKRKADRDVGGNRIEDDVGDLSTPGLPDADRMAQKATRAGMYGAGTVGTVGSGLLAHKILKDRQYEKNVADLATNSVDVISKSFNREPTAAAAAQAPTITPPKPATVVSSESVKAIPGKSEEDKTRNLANAVEEYEKAFLALKERPGVDTSTIDKELAEAKKEFRDAKSLNEKLEVAQMFAHAATRFAAFSYGKQNKTYIGDQISLPSIDYSKRTAGEREQYGTALREAEGKRDYLDKQDKAAYGRDLDVARSKKERVDIEQDKYRQGELNTRADVAARAAANRAAKIDARAEDRNILIEKRYSDSIDRQDKKPLQDELKELRKFQQQLTREPKGGSSAKLSYMETQADIIGLPPDQKKEAMDVGLFQGDNQRYKNLKEKLVAFTNAHKRSLEDRLGESRSPNFSEKQPPAPPARTDNNNNNKTSAAAGTPKGYQRVSVNGQIYDMPDADVAAALKDPNANIKLIK